MIEIPQLRSVQPSAGLRAEPFCEALGVAEIISGAYGFAGVPYGALVRAPSLKF